MILLGMAVGSLVSEAFWYSLSPPAPCNATFTDTIPCTTYNRRILIAAMVAYEGDTLAIALEEAKGVADVLLVENKQPHNPSAKGSEKPAYVWPRVRHLFRQRVYWRMCRLKRNGNGMWEAESADNACLSGHLKKLQEYYDVVLIASIDEILSRDNLLKLKHCELPKLPTTGAIGMPLGLLGRSFRTDWPARGYPYSAALPAIWPGNHRNPSRSVGARSNAMVGGLHATNYCFLPAMVLKELWATEYGSKMTEAILCSKSIEDHKRDCYNMLHHRVKSGTGPETVVPRILKACPASFPSWYGKVDDREIDFYNSICH